MAKRARGTTTRPGQRRPIQRPAARPSAPSARASSPAPVVAPRSASLTPDEEAGAAQLEAAIVAEERQAEETRRNRAQRSAADVPVRATSPLASPAASEYAYVARDIRRLAIVGGSLLTILFALWIVVQVTGVAV